MPCSGAMKGSKRAPDRDLLLARHSFPGEYVVKAFGPGRSEFAAAVESVAVGVMGTRFVARTRMSRHGNKSCVTLELHAETVDEVIDVYERLYAIETLLMIL